MGQRKQPTPAPTPAPTPDLPATRKAMKTARKGDAVTFIVGPRRIVIDYRRILWDDHLRERWAARNDLALRDDNGEPLDPPGEVGRFVRYLRGVIRSDASGARVPGEIIHAASGSPPPPLVAAWRADQLRRLPHEKIKEWFVSNLSMALGELHLDAPVYALVDIYTGAPFSECYLVQDGRRRWSFVYEDRQDRNFPPWPMSDRDDDGLCTIRSRWWEATPPA